MPKGRVPPRECLCAVCGDIFVGDHSQNKYCSDKCRRDGERASWRAYNARNREMRRTAGRLHYDRNAEKTSARVKAYRETEKGRAVRRRTIAVDPLKASARQAVRVEIKAGRMTRLKCEECGDPKSQAHHEDYSKPLQVRWLCPKCHGKEHRKPRPVEPIGDVV